MKVIASIEDRGAAPPDVIDRCVGPKILKHLGLDESSSQDRSQHNRSPPGELADSTTLS